jgi:hypothetical protein
MDAERKKRGKRARESKSELEVPVVLTRTPSRSERAAVESQSDEDEDKHLGTSINTIGSSSLATAQAPSALKMSAKIPTHLRNQAQKCLYLFGKMRWQSSGVNEVERHALLRRISDYEEQVPLEQCSYDTVCEVFRDVLDQSYKILPAEAWFKYVGWSDSEEEEGIGFNVSSKVV